MSVNATELVSIGKVLLHDAQEVVSALEDLKDLPGFNRIQKWVADAQEFITDASAFINAIP